MKTTRTKSTKKAIRIDILSLFPESFSSYLGESILKRAQEKKLVSFAIHDIRDFAEGPHRLADDRPFGGSPGMVLKIEPIYRTLQSIRKKKKARTVLFSTRGNVLNENIVRRLAKYDQLILVCGRYEGVDERVTELVDEEISLGDFVLSGGELPALVLAEAVARFIPGVLGKTESIEYRRENRRSYPVYTRPETFTITKKGKKKRMHVPKVLLSGDHKKIEEWRRAHAEHTRHR